MDNNEGISSKWAVSPRGGLYSTKLLGKAQSHLD